MKYVIILFIIIAAVGFYFYQRPAPCSNSLYETETNWPSGLTGLTNESQEKLENALKEQGDSALWGISDLDCLGTLDLSITGISDLSPLSKLTNLKDLFLTSTGVSDLSPLIGLTKLQTLSLSATPVRDISPLMNLENLNILTLLDTQVSEEDCNSLKSALPRTQIRCDK